MSKKRMITKSVIFLLILAFILKIFSSLSIAMGYNANPLYNYSSYSIFQEPDNSIDVLSIGDSNVYSSIFPLVWWEQQGFTGYTWGQPSQRIPETYEYLKKIYKHQKPSIVLIDGNNLFRDKTDIDNLDSITKAQATVLKVAEQVKKIVDDGMQVAIVIGGGNFWRGRTSENMERTKADQIGMLATVMNCIYVSDMFRHVGMKTKIYTPFTCGAFTELFSKDDAVKNLEEGVVTFFAGGTGHPYFSTDTATALRAIEIEADAILLAKAIDGVYDSDPKVNPDAVKYDEISLDEVLSKKLGVIDLTATIMCLENKMPLVIFGLEEENSIVNTMSGNFNGTYVTV